MKRGFRMPRPAQLALNSAIPVVLRELTAIINFHKSQIERAWNEYFG